MKGLTSDAVLAQLRDDLIALGFEVEAGKHAAAKIRRPVFFGENGKPDLKYEIDAYKDVAMWAGGRGWSGLDGQRGVPRVVQALVMVELDHLVLAVPNGYRYQNSGKDAVSRDYENTGRRGGCAVRALAHQDAVRAHRYRVLRCPIALLASTSAPLCPHSRHRNCGRAA